MVVQRVPARRGFGWIREGWTLLWSSPLVIYGQLLTVLMAALMLHQILGPAGSLLSELLGPAAFAGLYRTLARTHDHHDSRYLLLLSGFVDRFPTFVLYAVLSLGITVGFLLVAVLSLAAISGLALDVTHLSPLVVRALLGQPLALLVLVAELLVFVVVSSALSFAVPLIACGGVGILNALWLSFWGVTRNWAALLVYVLAWIILSLAAALTLGLALLVLIPLVYAAHYIAYTDLFRRPPGAEDVLPAAALN